MQNNLKRLQHKKNEIHLHAFIVKTVLPDFLSESSIIYVVQSMVTPSVSALSLLMLQQMNE